jgi:D-alanine-D-alanine ligase
MKVAILFDGLSALGASPDLLILGTVEAVEDILADDGATVVRIPVNPDGRWVERVRRGKFDLAFNLCEGIDGVAALEPAVVAVLELFNVPYTGSSSATTSLSLRKHVVNSLLERAGLPVPAWRLSRRGAVIDGIAFPAICKPAAEDASIGIEQRSVVRSQRALAARLREMHECWDEVLVQQFVDGREVNVGILGDEVLPVAEIDFGAMPRGMWRIVSYTSKWTVGSDEDLGAKPRCPADLPDALTAECQRVALAAWTAVGGAGYGRVDMRIDANGQPWILEVNANPDIAPDAGLARMARTAGIEYPQMIRAVCADALSVAPQMDAANAWALAERLSGAAPPLLDLLAAGQR